MVQPGEDCDLAGEPLGVRSGGDLGFEDLERDGAIVLAVTCQIHGRCRSAPQLALQGIPVAGFGGAFLPLPLSPRPLPAHALDQRHQAGRRRSRHLLPHPRLVVARLPQRAGPISRLGQCADQSDGGPLGQGIRRGDLAPQVDLRRVTPQCMRFSRQLPKRLGVLAGETRPLLLGPPLELRRVGEVEAVEKGAPVRRHRSRRITGRDRPPELHHVRVDDLEVQPERVGALEQLLRHLFPHRVEQLLQGVAGILGGALRPEIGEDLVAGKAPLARDREQGEESKPAALGDHRVPGCVRESQTPECPEPEHERPLRRE